MLREEHDFRGYIHLKTIPEAAPELLAQAGRYADRLSINVELPTVQGLSELAPEKDGAAIRRSMARLRTHIDDAGEAARSRAPTSQPMLPPRRARAPRFAPAGQIDADDRRRRCVRRPNDPRHQRNAVRRLPAEARLLLGIQPDSRCGARAAAEGAADGPRAPPLPGRLADALLRLCGRRDRRRLAPHAVARGRPEAGVGAGPPRALSGRPATRPARAAAARAGPRREGGAAPAGRAPRSPHPCRRPEAPATCRCRRSCRSSSSTAIGQRPISTAPTCRID